MAAGVIRAAAHGKVNLFLRVLGRRQDGFHDIETVFLTVGLADDLVVRISGGEPSVEVRMEAAVPAIVEVAGDESNLAHAAAAAYLEDAGIDARVEVVVRKQLPVGGGMGGGSADAAAVLLALDRAFGAAVGEAGLRRLALDLGSDVPFLLSGGAALGRGRGERLDPVAVPRGWHISLVLGISRSPVATADVYAGWDISGATPESHPAELVGCLSAGDAAGVAALLHNDLEDAVLRLRPELAAKKEAMLEAGALGASVSGSGPTVFAVVPDDAAAQDVAEAVKSVFDVVLAVRSVPTAVVLANG